MSTPQRYYASRQGGEPGGPYTVEELRQFLNAQQLDLDDQVCVEGDTTWRRLGDVAAIVPSRGGAGTGAAVAAAAAAAQPASAASPDRAAAKPAGGAKAPAGAKPAGAASGRPAAYKPGSRPTNPGIYVPFQDVPDDLLAVLQEVGTEKPAPVDPRAPGRRLRRQLALLLLGLSLGACVVDQKLGYPHPAFSLLTPLCWLGLVLTYAWTRLPRPRSSGNKVAVYLVAPALLGLAAVWSSPFLAAGSLGADGGRWFFGTLAVWLAAVAVGSTPAPPAPPSARAVRGRLGLATGMVEGLRDDVAPGKRLSGWLDLTGWDQESKRLKSQKNAAGAQVELLRDEWLRLRAPLRDGNELRLSCVDRVKVKRSMWRRNARGKSKQKPQRQQVLPSLEVSLRVNGALYRTRPAAAEALHIGQLTVAPPVVAPDSVSVLVKADTLSSDETLGVVLSLYRQLEPLPQAGRS